MRGFEPLTSSVSGSRSTRLSYISYKRVVGIEPTTSRSCDLVPCHWAILAYCWRTKDLALQQNHENLTTWRWQPVRTWGFEPLSFVLGSIEDLSVCASIRIKIASTNLEVGARCTRPLI